MSALALVHERSTPSRPMAYLWSLSSIVRTYIPLIPIRHNPLGQARLPWYNNRAAGYLGLLATPAMALQFSESPILWNCCRYRRQVRLFGLQRKLAFRKPVFFHFASPETDTSHVTVLVTLGFILVGIVTAIAT